MEENLVFRRNVSISASEDFPSGGGASDPHVLLNDRIYHIDSHNLRDYAQELTFDTFHGRDKSKGKDWYLIDFAEEIECNCIEMSMGFYYIDGGWWNSLKVEIPDGLSGWKEVENLSITPPLSPQDPPLNHCPFQTHLLRFDPVLTSKIRIIGNPGGSARFTSLSRLAVFQRDFSRWNPLELPQAEIPYYFQLISPELVWELSMNFMKLTGLTVDVPFMEYYLDNERYELFRNRVIDSYEYKQNANLVQMLGDTLGWNRNIVEWIPVESTLSPFIHYSSINGCAIAGAPIIVDNEVVCTITFHPPVIVKDEIDLSWHKQFSKDHDIDPETYQIALDNSIWMTREQLEGAANLLGLIANSIARLARRNLYLENVSRPDRNPKKGMKDLMMVAIEFMEDQLEEAISVHDVAQKVSLSSSYFSRRFSEIVGCSPSDMLIQLRIDRAKQYFTHPGVTVMDVCVMFGYSPSYFSRLFKRKVGMAPSEYIYQNKNPK
jgi:AraC-like DNA-binding protein